MKKRILCIITALVMVLCVSIPAVHAESGSGESSAFDSWFASSPDNLVFCGIDSDGSLYWKPDVVEWYLVHPVYMIYRFPNEEDIEVCEYKNGTSVIYYRDLQRVEYKNTFDHPEDGRMMLTSGVVRYSVVGSAPISGTYSPLCKSIWFGRDITNDKPITLDCKTGNSATKEYLQGDDVNETITCNVEGLTDLYNGYAKWSGWLDIKDTPILRIEPTEPFIDAAYSESSRPGSCGGGYNVSDGNGGATVSYTPIVNETDKSIFNPETGETTIYDSWRYDYITRTYTFSDGEGNTASVTYADDEIEIGDNGAVSSVQYAVVSSGNGGGGSGGAGTIDFNQHQHNYTETTTTAATCTTGGVKSFSCSCGDTYTQAIPALGHDWALETEVETEYDEQGEIITQGYKVFRCSRCGQEYRSITSGFLQSSVSLFNEIFDSVTGNSYFNIFIELCAVLIALSLFRLFWRGSRKG